MPKLVAGFAHIRRGTARYRGALRVTAKAVPAWTCGHDHMTPESARLCADAELERRSQGGREVIVLLHCGRCAGGGASSWWDDVPGEEKLACPRCGVLLRRLKLVVVGGGTAVDEGNGKH